MQSGKFSILNIGAWCWLLLQRHKISVTLALAHTLARQIDLLSQSQNLSSMRPPTNVHTHTSAHPCRFRKYPFLCHTYTHFEMDVCVCVHING
jgi:hypothetical protein